MQPARGVRNLSPQNPTLCCVYRLRLLSLFLVSVAAHAAPPLSPTNTADLFDRRKVWEVHLRFDAEQWKAIEPERSGGGRMGPPGMGGPGGAPGAMIARAFVEALDVNHDGRLDRAEFTDGFASWFAKWDVRKRGSLTETELQDGLNKEIGMPGPPGDGPPGANSENRQTKRNGLSAMSGVDFQYVHGDLEFAGEKFGDVAVRYKGNSSFMQAQQTVKKSFKVDLNKFEAGQKLTGVTKLNFNNNIMDASWMNEPLSYALFRDAGVPAPRTSYARLYVTVPGVYDHSYFGLYSLIENPDNKWAHETFGVKNGLILKPSTRELFQYRGDDWGKYSKTYDPKTEPTDAQTQRVIDLAKLVSQADDAEFARQLPDYLDLDEFARFMSVTVWLSTLDSVLAMGQNFVIYLHPKTNKFQFVPWDLDHSFGNFPMMGTQEEREQLSIRQPWVGKNRFLERVMNVDVVRTLYLAKLEEFQKSIFQPERFLQQVSELAPILREAVKAEDKSKAERFEKTVAGESVPGGPGGGAPGGRPREDAGGPPDFSRDRGDDRGRRGPGGMSTSIKQFVTARYQSVADQLAGKSTGAVLNSSGPPGRGGGRGRFGPGSVLATAIFRAGDADHDDALSALELNTLAVKWFSEWAVENVLGEKELAAGLDKTLPRGPQGPPNR